VHRRAQAPRDANKRSMRWWNPDLPAIAMARTVSSCGRPNTRSADSAAGVISDMHVMPFGARNALALALAMLLPLAPLLLTLFSIEELVDHLVKFLL